MSVLHVNKENLGKTKQIYNLLLKNKNEFRKIIVSGLGLFLHPSQNTDTHLK